MRFKVFIGYWFPVLAYILLIFYLSSLPNYELEDLSKGIGLDDSLEHFFEYSLLSILFFRLFNHYKKNNIYVKAIAFSTIYGITDEMHQLFVPTRVFSLEDMLFNLLGSIFAMFVVSLAIKISSGKKQ